MSKENNEAIFSVYAALYDLYKRVASLEKNMPDYLADLLEIGRKIGRLDKRLTELEMKLDTTVERLVNGNTG